MELFDGNIFYAAYKRALKASPSKPIMQKFEAGWLHELAVLIDELKAGEYEPGRKKEFVLCERGKTRLIRAASPRDKVVQHALCDSALTPAVTKKLIYDNYASLEGRGVGMARKRFEIMLHRYYRKHGTNEGYILLMDYSSFYDNMRHDKVFEVMAGIVEGEDALKLLRTVLKSCEQDLSFLADEEIAQLYYGKYKALDYIGVPKELRTGKKLMPKGLDIGDQVAQIIALAFPMRIDNYVKIVRAEKFYGRYMDDSFIISPSREHLLDVLTKIKRTAENLGIILNERKVKILPLRRPFRFLQVKYTLTRTGRVIRQINPKRVHAMRRKLKKLARMVESGERDINAAKDMFHSWKNAYFRLMSRAQRRNMLALYQKIFGGAK